MVQDDGVGAAECHVGAAVHGSDLLSVVHVGQLGVHMGMGPFATKLGLGVSSRTRGQGASHDDHHLPKV